MIKITFNKKNIIAVIAVLSLSLIFFAKPDRVEAQAGEPYEMLAEINALRAANGLSPLIENQYLNIAAQNHANWIAEDPAVRGGHTGAGGSTSYDRAVAAGYGEGKQVWVTENWARGYNLSVHDCVYNSWNDSAHMGNMLTNWHNEFGAGVALDIQGLTVYVVDFGHSSGSVSLQPTDTPGGPTSTSAPIIQPVMTSTPNPDGYVIHIVQYGQTLWAISDAYQIPLADLLSQNGLTEDSAIYPEDQLLIFPGDESTQEITQETTETVSTTGTAQTEGTTPSPTQTPTEGIEKTPTRTVRPVTPTKAPTETPKSNGGFLRNIFSGDTMWVGIGLVAVSLFGIALLLFTSSRLR